MLPIPRTGRDQAPDVEQELLALIQELHDQLVGNLVVHEPPLALPRHQPALPETLQVHRGIGLAESRARHDVSRCQRAITQHLENAEPRRICQPAEQLRLKLDALSSHIRLS
jgi:hypothetical protein